MFHVKDYMKCGLLYLGQLKRLDMGKVLSFLPVAFILASWAASPCEVSLNGIGMLFPAAAFPFKFIHSKS